MIERFGQMLIAIRKMIFGGGDPQEVESRLRAGSQQAGVDLDIVRGLSLDSLVMLVASDGEIEVDRAWLMAEILLLDGIQAARLDEVEHARVSLLKARALYDLVGPSGAMLVGIPDIKERLAEIDETLANLPVV
jgi:hypothetical protein